MSAARYDFIMEQGATFDYVITFYSDSSGTIPFDLTGYTARMDIKNNIDDATAIISLTTDNGRITLGGVNGTVQLVVSATDTAALNFERGVYDLELQSGSGVVTRLIQGAVTFEKEVTI